MSLRRAAASAGGAAARAIGRGHPEWAKGTRLAAAMMVPVTAGVLLGRGVDGLFVGIGAFVVASTDLGGAYRARAATLAAATGGVAAAYLLGAASGHTAWLASATLALILLGSALIATLGPAAAVVSTMVGVGFIVGAFLPSGLGRELRSMAEIVAGGAWAAALCLWRWPLDPRRPVREAIRAASADVRGFTAAVLAGEPDRVAIAARRRAARASLLAAREVVAQEHDRRVPLADSAGIAIVLYRAGELFDAALSLDELRRIPGPPGGRATALERVLAASVALRAAPETQLSNAWLESEHLGVAARARAVWAAASSGSPAVRHGARIAFAGALAVWVARTLDPAHGAWLVSSTVLVMRPTLGETLATSARRAAATVLGALLAGSLVALSTTQAVLILAASASAAVAMALMPLSYATGILTVTPLSILLTALLAPAGWGTAFDRVQAVLVGVAIAVAVGYLLFPTWIRDGVYRQLRAAFAAEREYLELALAPLRGARPDLRERHRTRAAAEAAVASFAATGDDSDSDPDHMASEPWSAAQLIAGARRILDATVALDQHVAHAANDGDQTALLELGDRLDDAIARFHEAAHDQGAGPAAAHNRAYVAPAPRETSP